MRSVSLSGRRSSDAFEKEVEGVEDELVGAFFGQGDLQGGEVGRALGVVGHDLAVEDAVGKRGGGAGDGGEPRGPVVAVAGPDGGLAVADGDLDAVAVELDLVDPAGAGRRAVEGLAKLRRDEVGDRGGGFTGGGGGFAGGGFAGWGFAGWGGLGWRGGSGALVGGEASVAFPDRVGGGGGPDHEGFGGGLPAGGDVGHGAARRDRAVFVGERFAVAVAGGVVAVLDQQPVGALAAGLVVLDADQDPAAVQALAFEAELEVAVGQGLLGGLRAFRGPVAAVPDLDGAAAVLALGDGALEVAVAERVVLDLDGEALVVRVERRAAGDGPGLEDAAELEAEVEMQAGGVVLLDDVAGAVGRADGAAAVGLGGLLEVALGAVAVEAFGHGFGPAVAPGFHDQGRGGAHGCR